MAGVSSAHYGRALTDDIALWGVTPEAGRGMCVAPRERPHTRHHVHCREGERDGRASIEGVCRGARRWPGHPGRGAGL